MTTQPSMDLAAPVSSLAGSDVRPKGLETLGHPSEAPQAHEKSRREFTWRLGQV